VCHQSVGLIARAIEAAGIPTVCLTSAWSITAAVWPPRAAFVDHPLGHTAGKPFDPEGQRRIVCGALEVLVDAREPGKIVDLGERWGSDEWREHPLTGGRGGGGSGRAADGAGGASAGAGDGRTPRFETPQYQTEEDARLAAARLGEEVACRACAVFDG
jgi:hypothetical protein